MAQKTTREILHETALKAPQSSGVYLWRNAENTVIYVGKAKNLKNRLCSYFSGQKNIKTKMLIAHAVLIEYITTTNEYEALLLENNLIKKYSPRYNINLKDGKSYPVLRITNEEFPRIFRTRSIFQDGSQYYGPFPNVDAVDTFLDTIYKLFPVRHCKVLRKRETPCLYYHMKQCKAPCCGKISKEDYGELISEISRLLEQKDDDAAKRMTEEMKAAAAELNFEKAARLRDGIKALMVLHNQNIVEAFDSEDKDYIAYWREGELVSFTVLKIRHGKLLGRENYRVESLNEDDELTGEFIAAYYEEESQIPPSIYVTTTTEYEIISKWLNDEKHVDTKVFTVSTDAATSSPQTSSSPHDIAAINMALQNAHEDIVRRLRERGDTPALEELKTLLNLDTLPVRIEGFDIAHIGGKFPVASLISFYNGNPDKKNYRYFRLKTTDGIIDDFASMREATTRRYTRLLNEQAELPDLIMIDGGLGQVNAVEGVLQALNLDIPIVGLAKRDEELYLPGNSTPICVPRRSDALRLLQRVRDETHRFATSRNQNLRTKENTKSLFLELPNVGEKRALKLQKTFLTLENLASQEVAAISNALSIKDDNEAAEILLAAKELLKVRNEKKELQKASLGISGTTKEKAAEAQYIDDLASLALTAAENTPDYGDNDN
ncbi:MAG: excinuclease ABC subunit UvrC [Treponema sp.]|nr:excinuclease ABC subunit UvrC [Treponema sp.]